MKSLTETLIGLGKTRLAVLAGIGAALVVAIVVAATVLSSPAMTTLYSGLDPAEASRVVKAIEQMGVRVEAGADGTSVSVPRSEVPRVRMQLAEAGLPSKGGVGYEIFDGNGALGMTSFMQKVNRIRALEGELARTIQTIKGVEAARVHLVLPDREAFSRERPEPSASVVVRLRGGVDIERAQALAIRHLVSSSVPGLKPAGVTVMDSNGDLVLGETRERQSPEQALQDASTSIETKISKAVEQMLTARVGIGNVRVQVSADIDTRREVVRSQRFDPKEQVVRSTQTVEEKEKSDETRNSSVSVQSNLPQGQGGSGEGQRSDRARNEETINYEISSTTSETVTEPGAVRRLTVAVLVNGHWEKDADGKPVYRERDKEELDRLAALVRSAAGVSEQRGDVVTVDSLQFVDYSLDVTDPVRLSVSEVITANLMTIVGWIVMLAVIALVLVLGVRPVLRLLNQQSEEAAAVRAAEEQATKAAEEQAKAAEETKAAAEQTAASNEDEMVQLSSVSGQVKAHKLRKLMDIIEENPDETLKVMKAWLATEVR